MESRWIGLQRPCSESVSKWKRTRNERTWMAKITHWLEYEWSERKLTSATNTMQLSDLHIYLSCVQRALGTAGESPLTAIWTGYNHGKG